MTPALAKKTSPMKDIHEIMNIIHEGNPPKYKIVRQEDMTEEKKE